MGGEGAQRTGSSASGRRGVGKRVSFELFWGKGCELEKNLRFAMRTRLKREIFLRFGDK